MKRMAMRVVAVVGLTLLASVWPDVRSTKAYPQILGASCVSYVPLAWGEYKGGSQQSGLAFQDSKGTLRFVTNLPCDAIPQPALEIRRTVPNN